MDLSAVQKGRSSKEKQATYKRPNYAQLVDAIGYWGVIMEMGQFFEKAEMESVSRHMRAACDEIDRIWTEGDYDLKK